MPPTSTAAAISQTHQRFEDVADAEGAEEEGGRVCLASTVSYGAISQKLLVNQKFDQDSVRPGREKNAVRRGEQTVLVYPQNARMVRQYVGRKRRKIGYRSATAPRSAGNQAKHGAERGRSSYTNACSRCR